MLVYFLSTYLLTSFLSFFLSFFPPQISTVQHTHDPITHHPSPIASSFPIFTSFPQLANSTPISNFQFHNSAIDISLNHSLTHQETTTNPPPPIYYQFTTNPPHPSNINALSIESQSRQWYCSTAAYSVVR